MRPSSAGGNTSSSSGFSSAASASGSGATGRRQLHDRVGADVGGQQDQRVLEVDPPPGAVLHHALVEHLEEHFVDVGMGLLDFVEQDHAIGLPPHRFGQPAALAIADIAGRRAFQRRDRMRLLEFRHVDGDDVLLAAIERLGQRQRGLGLADARGAAEHEDADGLVRDCRVWRGWSRCAWRSS